MDPKNLTDEQLMAMIAHDNMEALGLLISRHQQNVLNLARRVMGNRDIAEDIVQDTFLRVYRAAARYRPDAKFSTWLYRIVVNLCMDEKRKYARRAISMSVEHLEADLSADSMNPTENLEKNEQKKLIWDALFKLNKRERVAVILHRFQNMTHKEIAETTGWSPSAVESLIVRAYRHLRSELADLK